ncbi:MAG: hypothetical protein P4L67_04210 [Candidatus Pacebacteria bacterium]|nr:hypothetical protein [Candidatus Paceibacterota bacterium]
MDPRGIEPRRSWIAILIRHQAGPTAQFILLTSDKEKLKKGYNGSMAIMNAKKIGKEWILRFRATDKDNFLEIRNGVKVVETRAATPKYRGVKKGDVLVIVCGRDRLKKSVRCVSVFSSIGAMTKAIPHKKIMPSASSVAEMRKVYYGYPGYREKLKKYGVIAFEI